MSQDFKIGFRLVRGLSVFARKGVSGLHALDNTTFVGGQPGTWFELLDMSSDGHVR